MTKNTTTTYALFKALPIINEVLTKTDAHSSPNGSLKGAIVALGLNVASAADHKAATMADLRRLVETLTKTMANDPDHNNTGNYLLAFYNFALFRPELRTTITELAAISLVQERVKMLPGDHAHQDVIKEFLPSFNKCFGIV